jgi:molecular chaperone GrpE (heat shock protein)
MIKLIVPCILLMTAGALAQTHHRDPLTNAEIDQVRDAAQEPEARLKLYVAFARARLDRLQQAQSDPKMTNKDGAIRDALQDFIDVYDELSDNVDTYADRGDDLRKALRPVIEGDTEFG